MKKSLSIAIIITAMSLPAMAQDAKKKDRFANIDLTAQQKTSIDSVRKIYNDKRTALKKDASVSAEAKTEKMKAIQKEHMSIINTFLTPAQ